MPQNEAVLPAEILLSGLKVGTEGKILRITSSELKIALMGLGLSEGDAFAVTDRAPFGGPIALKANGTKVALRESDAKLIWVVRINEG